MSECMSEWVCVSEYVYEWVSEWVNMCEGGGFAISCVVFNNREGLSCCAMLFESCTGT